MRRNTHSGQSSVKAVLVGALTILFGTLLTVIPFKAAMAACPTPTITLKPPFGILGAKFDVIGRDFFAKCSEQASEKTPGSPDKQIAIEFVQGSQVWQIGKADAAKDGRFTLEVTIPEQARVGRAMVQALGASGSPWADFRVGELDRTATESPPSGAETSSPSAPQTGAGTNKTSNLARDTNAEQEARRRIPFGVLFGILMAISLVILIVIVFRRRLMRR